MVVNIFTLLLYVVTTFEINKEECGTQQKLFMPYEKIERIAYLYIPTQFCSSNNFSSYINKYKLSSSFAVNTSKHHLEIPTFVGFHCLGCNPSWEYNKWKLFSDKYGFILIIPKGGGINEKPSWNADVCCDPSLDKDYDDIGFIHKLVTKIFINIPLLYPYISVSFNSLFMTGFSNGAFLVDKFGWNSVANIFPQITAISPMAGYIYDHKRYVDTHTHDYYSAMPIWIHHSATDEVVNINGCCVHKPCTFGIGKTSKECVSVQQEWINWVKWNKCNINKYNITFNNIAHTNNGYLCAFATKLDHECIAETRLCIHPQTPHSRWAKKFPLSEEVILFFLKVLCENNNGIWNANDNICDCLDNNKIGRYCETLKNDIDIKWNKIYHQIKHEQEYLQINENERYIKNKTQFMNKHKWENRNIPFNNDHIVPTHQNNVNESDSNFGEIIKYTLLIVAFTVGIVLCVISYCFRNTKKIRKYKMLPQDDCDIDIEYNDGENSDSSGNNYTHNNGLVRNRNTINS